MKHKNYRDKYFEDYTAVKEPAANRKGYRMVYRYIGLWASWTSEKTDLGTVKKILGVWEITSLLLYVLCGSVNTAVNSCRLASGFAILSIIPWMLEISGVVRLCVSGSYVKERSYEEIDRSIRSGCWIRIGLGGLSLLIALGAALLGGDFALTDGLCAAGSAISLFLSYAVWHSYQDLLVDKYRNEDGKPGKRC